jgi:hypothetical protein
MLKSTTASLKPAEVEKRQGFPGRSKGKTNAKLEKSEPVQSVDDSRFVQSENAAPANPPPPPPAFIPDNPAALAIWREIWSAPDASVRLRLKTTDSAFIARYCWKRARVEAYLAKTRIKTTYVTTTTTGAKKVVSDQEYTHIMAMMATLLTDEEQIGLTPRARIAINRALSEVRDPSSPPANVPPQPPSAHGAPGAITKPASPVGLLAAAAPPASQKH